MFFTKQKEHMIYHWCYLYKNGHTGCAIPLKETHPNGQRRHGLLLRVLHFAVERHGVSFASLEGICLRADCALINELIIAIVEAPSQSKMTIFER